LWVRRSISEVSGCAKLRVRAPSSPCSFGIRRPRERPSASHTSSTVAVIGGTAVAMPAICAWPVGILCARLPTPGLAFDVITLMLGWPDGGSSGGTGGSPPASPPDRRLLHLLPHAFRPTESRGAARSPRGGPRSRGAAGRRRGWPTSGFRQPVCVHRYAG